MRTTPRRYTLNAHTAFATAYGGQDHLPRSLINAEVWNFSHSSLAKHSNSSRGQAEGRLTWTYFPFNLEFKVKGAPATLD